MCASRPGPNHPRRGTMIESVPISKIRPNPTFTRAKDSEAMSEDAIAMLAQEIKKIGWFGGALKARQVNGRYELAYGHRRLEALRKLGREAVDLEIEEISDEDMARFMAVENFQRHALTEEEKIRVWKTIKKQCGNDSLAARKLLGLGRDAAVAYDRALEYDSRKSRPAEISAYALYQADELGGEEMVKVAQKHRLGQHAIKEIRAKIEEEAGRDNALKERLVKKAKEGKILHAEDVKKEAWKVKEKKFDEEIRDTEKKFRKKHGIDVMELLSSWHRTFPGQTRLMKAVHSDSEYIECMIRENPKMAREVGEFLLELAEIAGKLGKAIRAVKG